MTTLGGAGFVISQDEVLKLLSALATLLGIVWSIWEKRGNTVPANPEVKPLDHVERGAKWLPLLAIIPLIGILALTPGCSTNGTGSGGVSITNVVTAPRVRAVVTWGTYAAARSQLPAAREQLERAKTGLETLQLAGSYDVPSVAAALQAGGITWLSTTEGNLTIAAVMSFQDIFADTIQPIASSEYVKAVLEGALSGLQLALATERSYPWPTGTDALWLDLQAKAEATR